MRNNKFLWVCQAFLGLTFAFQGGAKIVIAPIDLATMGPGNFWVVDAPAALVIVIGVLELAGAIGLILPWLLGIHRYLTAWAAAGLALTMVAAAILHVVRVEYEVIPINLIFAAIGILVFLGRRNPASPIAPGGQITGARGSG